MYILLYPIPTISFLKFSSFVIELKDSISVFLSFLKLKTVCLMIKPPKATCINLLTCFLQFLLFTRNPQPYYSFLQTHPIFIHNLLHIVTIKETYWRYLCINLQGLFKNSIILGGENCLALSVTRY